MSFETFANSDTTTLSGGINNSATVLVVTSPSTFPATPNFRLLIDQELLLVTAISSSSFTVTRGVEGTSAASHTDGTLIVGPLTAQALQNLRADGAITDTQANRPAAAIAGRRFLPTDGLYHQHDSGSAWSHFGYQFPMTPPVSGDFSWVNQGAGTVSTAQGSTYLSAAGTGTSGDNLICRVKTVPSAPYSITAAFLPQFGESGYSGCGLCLRASGSGKIVTFSVTFRLAGVTYLSTATGNMTKHLQFDKYTDQTTFSATYLQKGAAFEVQPCWFKLEDDNTNRNCYVSADGAHWSLVGQTTRTDFITPNQVGFFINTNALSYSTVGMNLLSWVQA